MNDSIYLTGWMRFTFDDKNPAKVLELSKKFEDIQDPKIAINTLVKACKEYRIIPHEVGRVFHDVLPNPCALCSQHRAHKCKLRELPCKHMFHDRCIKNWLIENNMRCYICKSLSLNMN